MFSQSRPLHWLGQVSCHSYNPTVHRLTSLSDLCVWTAVEVSGFVELLTNDLI